MKLDAYNLRNLCNLCKYKARYRYLIKIQSPLHTYYQTASSQERAERAQAPAGTYWDTGVLKLKVRARTTFQAVGVRAEPQITPNLRSAPGI
jgi:hypothetical protein